MSSEEQKDIDFWNNCLDKVLKELTPTNPFPQISEDRDFERPTLKPSTVHNGHFAFQCPTPSCEDEFHTFKLLLLHLLSDHARFDHSLLDDLKNGSNIRHVY